MASNKSDLRDVKPERIYGKETEYTLLLPKGKTVPSFDTLGHSVDNLMSVVYPHEMWGKNGSRTYPDKELMEHATAECQSAGQLAAHEKAGEYIMRLIANQIGGAVYKRSGYTDIHAADGQQIMVPMSTGHHENYSTGLPTWYHGSPSSHPHIGLGIRSLLLTRAIYAGTGIVTHGGFEISQKTNAIDYDTTDSAFGVGYTSVTHGAKRPFKITGQSSSRLELRDGEGNMSPDMTRIIAAATSLALRLVEQDAFPDELILSNKRNALARQISRAPETMFTTATGHLMTATEHQRRIAQAGLDLAEKQGDIPADEINGALQLIELLDSIDIYLSNPGAIDLISDTVDWAAKLHYMQTQAEARGQGHLPVNADTFDFVRDDLAWGRLGPNAPAATWYRERGNSVTDKALRTAIEQPPRTRAAARVRAIAAQPEAPKSVGWEKILTSDSITISLPDPHSYRS